METESHSELNRWQVVDNEKTRSKFADFIRRVNELQLEHYPEMIQQMVMTEDYANLTRFGDAFKSRTDFSQTYTNVTGTNIHVRDHYDLFAYMYMNSELDDSGNIAMQYSIDYIRRQVEESLTKSRGTQTSPKYFMSHASIQADHASHAADTPASHAADTPASHADTPVSHAVASLADTPASHAVASLADTPASHTDDTEMRTLIFECCQDQKCEMFEEILGYVNIVTEDLYTELELMNEYLKDQRVYDLRIFCDNKHEIKMVKPYDLFITLTPDERMEIVSGEWKNVNLYNRSPFYTAFLVMMYPMEVVTSKEICIRHPFLMISRGYIDELAISIVSFSRSETVIRRIVSSYAENFRLDEGNFVVSCLNKLT